MSDENSAVLLERLRDGCEAAAEELFSRYVERLTRLARSRLSRRLASRSDPEDVVLSAYRSFFIGARNGRFSLERSGDLWRLLVSITLRKLYRAERFNRASKRSIDSELSIFDADAFTRQPSPDEVIGVADQLEHLMQLLSPLERKVLELRLQDFNHAEIASEVRRSERTIRRSLERIRDVMRKQHESNE